MSEADRVAWATGEFIIDGGYRYKIKAGNTYAELGNQALPSSSGAATQKVIVYFDLKQTPTFDSNNNLEYKFDALPATTAMSGQAVFKESSSRYKVAWVEYRSPKANFFLYHEYDKLGDTNNHVALPAADVVTAGSVTPTQNVLANQKWSTNLIINGTGIDTISWNNGNANTNATMEFANGSTITLQHGALTLVANTSYVLLAKSVDGSGDPTPFVAGNTYNLEAQTNYASAAGDNKIVLALVTTGVSGIGTKPTILPMGDSGHMVGFKPILNGVHIDAQSISATNIKAGTITATQLTGTNLSALYADLGTITAGSLTGVTVTGGTVQTGAGTDGVIRLQNDKLKFYGDSASATGVDAEMLFYDDTSSTDEVFGVRTIYWDTGIPTGGGGTPTMKWQYEMIYGKNVLFYSDPTSTATAGNQVDSRGAFSPYATNNNYLGTALLRWKGIYLNTSPDVSSDERLKTNIVDFSNTDSLALVDSLRPRKFNFRTNPDDLSYGLVAQEVETALEGLSIDKTKLDLITFPLMESYVTPAGDTELGMRALKYEQLIAPLIGAVKELKRRIEVLEAS